ncbi:hypothetical protein ACIREE_05980 [Streptomyces sp. NPDC102467]|uniref:hypothetical protein n=1 Tax=Streptomyces sp. NPDC102467 TaxID=3366179 RepID=UPI003820B37E
MRKLAALLTTAAAAATLVGITGTTAQAGAESTYIGRYAGKSACVDAGQQYVREGYKSYSCLVQPGTPYYDLFVS